MVTSSFVLREVFMFLSNGLRTLSSIRSVLTALFLISAASCDVSAQVLYGSLTGTVTDQSKGMVTAAVVTIANLSTGLTRSTTTDAAGYFAIQNLPQGSYDVSISAPGFKPLTEKSVNVRINNVTRLEMKQAPYNCRLPKPM